MFQQGFLTQWKRRDFHRAPKSVSEIFSRLNFTIDRSSDLNFEKPGTFNKIKFLQKTNFFKSSQCNISIIAFSRQENDHPQCFSRERCFRVSLISLSLTARGKHKQKRLNYSRNFTELEMIKRENLGSLKKLLSLYLQTFTPMETKQ